MIIRIKNLSKKFGTKVLFDEAQAAVYHSEKVALLGQNGSGKTTLIRCISGEEAFEGIVEVDNSANISIMQQEEGFENDTHSFTEYLQSKHEKIEERKRDLELALCNTDSKNYEKILSEYTSVCANITEKIAEEKLKRMLVELKFELADYDKRICDLSGGQRTKLRLVECLSKKADIYVLDEPTNHLDFCTREWLESTINRSAETFLVISHDRYFLDKVVHKIIEIENKRLVTYDANYTKYLEQREVHLAELAKQFRDVTKEKTRLQKSADQKREWAQINYSWRLRMDADNLERAITRLPDVSNPEKFSATFELRFKSGPRTGLTIFEARNLCKRFGNQIIFDDVNFTMHSNQRVAVLGENGSGKSTLLKILYRKLRPDSGELIRASELKIGYFDQELSELDPKQRVLDFLTERGAHMEDYKIFATLVKFGFPREKFRDRIGSLSGGEKVRLCLVSLMVKGYNVLILDEPTNNLDLELIESLESALLKYDGTVIFASHDRYFIKKIATVIFEIKYKSIDVKEV